MKNTGGIEFYPKYYVEFLDDSIRIAKTDAHFDHPVNKIEYFSCPINDYLKSKLRGIVEKYNYHFNYHTATIIGEPTDKFFNYLNKENSQKTVYFAFRDDSIPPDFWDLYLAVDSLIKSKNLKSIQKFEFNLESNYVVNKLLTERVSSSFSDDLFSRPISYHDFIKFPLLVPDDESYYNEKN
jgi:hypothetical protein